MFKIFAISTISSKHLIVPEQIVNPDGTVPDGKYDQCFHYLPYKHLIMPMQINANPDQTPPKGMV